LLGARCPIHFVPGRFQFELNDTAELVFIFNNQYSSGGHISNCSTRVNCLDGGQGYFKTGSLAGFAKYLNLAAMFVDYFCHDRQSQANALRFGGEEWVEDAFQVLGLYANPLIGDGNNYVRVFKRHADLHLLAGRTCLNRILHQILERHLQQICVKCEGAIVLHIQAQGNVLGLCQCGLLFQHIFQDGAQVCRRWVNLQRPREI
jgi:hypothetical protein